MPLEPVVTPIVLQVSCLPLVHPHSPYFSLFVKSSGLYGWYITRYKAESLSALMNKKTKEFEIFHFDSDKEEQEWSEEEWEDYDQKWDDYKELHYWDDRDDAVEAAKQQAPNLSVNGVKVNRFITRRVETLPTDSRL